MNRNRRSLASDESIAWHWNAMPLFIAAAVLSALFMTRGADAAAEEAGPITATAASAQPTAGIDFTRITPSPEPGEGEPAPAVLNVPTY